MTDTKKQFEAAGKEPQGGVLTKLFMLLPLLAPVIATAAVAYFSEHNRKKPPQP